MNAEEMKMRTKGLALRILRLIEEPPHGKAAEVVSRQLLRSATSVGANYRAACRAKSQADFVYKMGIVEEESDETLYWLELLTESGLIKKDCVSELIDEANQLVAITVSSIKTARRPRS